MTYQNLNDNELLYFVSDNNYLGSELLYKKYEPIILSIAKESYNMINNTIYDFDDLVQYGYIGLQNAIDNYDKDKNVLFYTFAIFCIRREINRSIFLSNRHYSNNTAYYSSLYDNEYLSIESYQIDDNINTRYLESKLKEFSLELDFDSSLVFTLRLNGFSYKEISILLEIKLKKVDYIIQKCKSKLKSTISI